MSFIDMDLGGNVAEPKPVAAGRYPLVITEATYNGDKNYVKVSIAVDGRTDVPNFNHFISLPKKDDEPSKAEFKRLMMKRFLVQFNIPFDDNGFELTDFHGARADGNLALTEPDKQSGAVYNNLNVDRLPG